MGRRGSNNFDTFLEFLDLSIVILPNPYTSNNGVATPIMESVTP